MTTVQSPKATGKQSRSRKSIAHLPSQDVSLEKENTTIDSAAIASTKKAITKKPRSKSLGPGGLNALTEDAGNRQKALAFPSVKSILKPTIPLSPPKQIPPHSTTRKISPRKGGISPKRRAEGGPLPESSSLSIDLGQSGHGDLHNPFQESYIMPASQDESELHETRMGLRTIDELQVAAKEQERQDIINRRDARRKSLANRRVSFAPEATLHTWNVVELPEDSTTSSASTNSTRRASTLSGDRTSPQAHVQTPSSDPSEAPSTPPEQVEELLSTLSPAHQRDLHQRKRRRSSVIPPMNFNNPDDFSSSPTSSLASDETSSQHFTLMDGNIDASDSSDDDVIEGESTVTGVDCDNDTSNSRVSSQSNGSSNTGSSGRLEEALRQAARQAGTQGIDYDENEDFTMEIAEEEVTAAFKPWMKRGKYTPAVVGHPSAFQDQENLNPFSPAFKANLKAGDRDDDQDQTMDLTQAAGTILPRDINEKPSSGRGRRQSVALDRRRNSLGRSQSSSDDSVIADETMEFTTAIGGIHQDHQKDDEAQGDAIDIPEDEDITMDFTTVIGGVVGTNNEDVSTGQVTLDIDVASKTPRQEDCRRKSNASAMSDDDMDITTAMGGILSSNTERTEPEEDQTMGMDITTAIGGILPEELTTTDKSLAKALMEHEADAGQLASSPFHKGLAEKSAVMREETSPKTLYLSTMTSETGSPSLAHMKTRSSARQSVESRLSTTPKIMSQRSTPHENPTTPSKQVTPKLRRPTTPGKTPPLKNVSMRTGSPKKLFKAQIKQATSTPKLAHPTLKFGGNETTRMITPAVVLTPSKCRMSGLGIDREGLGSPRVAAILDRRGSISDQAKSFIAQEKPFVGVRFQDPRTLEHDLDKERAEEERRESGRHILQAEADVQDREEDKDATTNLKDMIESLTPKKKKLKGRKSLHVGAAKGLLGKRPVELDEDDDDDELSPKRLKGRDRSPVKNIKLPAPPSKTETTGRVLKAPRFSLGTTAATEQLSTPNTDAGRLIDGRITTPKDQGRFKNAELLSSTAKPVTSFDEKLASGTGNAEELTEEDERINLQDFLNMTSIRFMELTTTKRRHTVAPTPMVEDTVKKSGVKEGDDVPISERELECCVVAGACTVPMLELYQHSCRELKKYISEGRSIVREIEMDTFEENPPLFREYMAAAPEVRAIMDNQFKNVKTHARLLSKAMWYEWRMKLLDGLKEGLLRIGEGLNEDDAILAQQEDFLQPIFPSMLTKQEFLEGECRRLQAQADELASCDQEELTDARDHLVAVEQDIEARGRLVADLQKQLQERETGIEQVIQRKQECLGEIKEAEKVREECRGWSVSEVAALKANVDVLETTHGWTITSASSSSLTLIYRSSIRLLFHPTSFIHAISSNSPTTRISENSPISLTYIADTHEYHPQSITTEKHFFLQIMRARLQCLHQPQVKVQGLLGFVSQGWELACSVAEEARTLGLTYFTEPTILSDEVLAVRSTLLLRAMRTKVEVMFEVAVGTGEDQKGLEKELSMDVNIGAKVVYGESLNESKMGEFLKLKIGEGRLKGWAKAVGELEERLLVRGKKAA